MTNQLGSLSSANISSVKVSDKSGQSAAQVLSNADDAAKSIDVTGKERAAPGKGRELTGEKNSQSGDDVEKQVQNLQEFGQAQGWTVNFSVEKELNKVVIKVVDAETKSTIRQIPSEELLAISKRIQDLRQGEAGASPKVGLLFDSEI